MGKLSQLKVTIYTSEKRKNSLECPLKHFITGINKIKFVLLDFHPEHVSIIKKTYLTFLTSLLLLNKRNKSFTVVSLQKNKWMTLNDKRIFSNPNSLIISWLQTLARELTGKEKDFKPFWNQQCLENSKKLWLPIETDYVDLHSNSSNSYLKVVESNSSFSILKMENPQNKNCLRTYSPSFTFTHVDQWVNEDTRTKKIRLYPNVNQRKILKNWLGTTRWVYNKTLEYIKSQNLNRVNVVELTSKFITEKTREGIKNSEVPEWTFDTPKDIRKGALRDIEKAYKTAFTNLKNGNITRFQLRYKSKKSSTSVEIPNTAIKYKDGDLEIYKSRGLGKIKISRRQKKKDNIDITQYCRLQCIRNQWFLCVPYKKSSEERKEPEKEVCSLDPGVRTFQTIYSATEVIKVQHNRDTFRKLRDKLDHFKSLRAQKIISSSTYKRRHDRIQRRLLNISDEIHYKTIQILRNYRHILLPSFENQEMVSRNRSLSSKTKREMFGLRHYVFKNRIQTSMNLDRFSNVNIVSEEYTSKTCSNCGIMNTPGTDIYKCSNCNLVIDRDMNGARNILLKHLKNI